MRCDRGPNPVPLCAGLDLGKIRKKRQTYGTKVGKKNKICGKPLKSTKKIGKVWENDSADLNIGSEKYGNPATKNHREMIPLISMFQWISVCKSQSPMDGSGSRRDSACISPLSELPKNGQAESLAIFVGIYTYIIIYIYTYGTWYIYTHVFFPSNPMLKKKTSGSGWHLCTLVGLFFHGTMMRNQIVPSEMDPKNSWFPSSPHVFQCLSSFLVVFLPFWGLIPPSDSTSKSLGSMPATLM